MTGHSTTAASVAAAGSAPAAGSLVSSFTAGKFNAKAAWPVLRWDDNETICGRLVAGGVEIVAGDLAGSSGSGSGSGGAESAAAVVDSKSAPDEKTAKRKVLGKIPADGIQHFSIAPKADPIAIATFVPSRKDTPARVGLWEWSAAAPPTAPKSFKSLFTEEAEMKWHPNGVAVLIQSSSEVDKTNKSYYGESGLYVLSVDGKVSVAIDKSGGTVCDCAWNPNGKEFVVIQGCTYCHCHCHCHWRYCFLSLIIRCVLCCCVVVLLCAAQPARARAYSIQGNPHFEFGTNARNTIRFAPHARCM